MAEGKPRSQMMDEAKQKTMQLATQGSQTKQLFAQAQQKSPQDFNQLVNALNDSSKTMEQLEDQIKKLANKMASQGKISKQTAAAVNIQMNDKQLREKIAQFSQFDIKANIQGSPKDIDKIQKSLSSLIKQAKKGNKDAQALLKSLSSADFKQLKNADKILKNLSDCAQQAGVSLQQLNKNTLKGCTVFNNFKNKAKETSDNVEQYSDMLYTLADKMKLTSDSTRGLITGLAGVGGVTMAAIKGLNDLHKQFDSSITSIIQFKRNSQFASAANSDILPGGVQQLQQIRTSMNLTREQTVNFAQGLSKLRGTTYDVNDLTAAMQGMKDTIGKIDTKQLENLTSLMQKVPKQQLDAITKGTGTSQDAAAGVLNIVNSGQQQAFLRAGASGAFGKQYAQNMGVKIDQNDRQYTQNAAMVKRVTQSVQILSHNATNFFTKALPLIGGVMVANKMLGKVASGGGMVKGLIGGIKGLFGKGKGNTGKSGLSGVISTVKNAVIGVGKNMAQSNNGQNTQTVAVGVQGKLDKIISLLQKMVGQNNSVDASKNQDNTEAKNESTDNTINNAVNRITKTIEKAPGRNFKAGALKFGRNFSKKAASLGKGLGGKIGGKTGKIVADVFSKIGAKGLNLSKWVGNLGTKILPHLGKVFGVVGIAAGMAIQGFKGFKQGLQDAADAAKFFGHRNKGTSTGQDVQNVVTGITGGNMVQGFINMFRDKDQVQKERIVNAQAGVSNTSFGTNTAGAALLGASIGGVIGGPIGAAVGVAIGAGIGLLVDATNQIQKAIKKDKIQAIQKTYDIMKAAKDQQQKNDRQRQVMMQHSVKMAAQNKKILQAIYEGQFSILETVKASQALFKNKKQNQLVSGISSQQYSQNNTIAVQQAGEAFSKDMQKLQQQRAKIQNDPMIQGQVKLKLLNDIMQQQIKIRHKYNQQLLQATDLNNIPKVIENQLSKRINTASAQMSATGMYGSSQGIIDDLGGNIEATMSTLFAQVGKIGQNSQHYKKMKQDQQKRVEQARDNSFAAAFGGINSETNLQGNIDVVNNVLQDIKGLDIGGLTTATRTGNLRNDQIINDWGKTKQHVALQTEGKDIMTRAASNAVRFVLPIIPGADLIPDAVRHVTTSTRGDVNTKFSDEFEKINDAIRAGNLSDAVNRLRDAQDMLNRIGTAETKMKAAQLEGLRRQLEAQNAASKALGNFASNVKEFKQGTDISQTSLGSSTKNAEQLQQRKEFLDKAFSQGAIQIQSVDKKGNIVKKTKDGWVDEKGQKVAEGEVVQDKIKTKVKDAKKFQQLYKKQSIRALYETTANMGLGEKNSAFQRDALDENKNIKKQYQSFLQKDQNGKIRVKKNLNEQQQKALRAFLHKNKDAYIAENGQKAVQKLFGKSGSIKYTDSAGKEKKVTKDDFTRSLRQTQQLVAKQKGLTQGSREYKLNQAKIRQNQQLQYNVLMSQKNVTIDKAALKKAKQARDELGYGSYQDYEKKAKEAGKPVLDRDTWEAQKITRQDAYNQALKGQMDKVHMQTGGTAAGLSAIDTIQAANRQMATPIVANAKNMQDLSKTFTELDQNIGKLIDTIKNDPNVRRKLMQAQLKGLQKQMNAWNGKTDAKGNTTVGIDNVAAYNAELDAVDQQLNVADKVAQQLERLSSITTQGGADAIKAVAASFKKSNIKDINVVSKNEKGQMVDAQGNVVKDPKKAKKQSFTDSIFDIASKAASSKDDKTISGALDTIQKQYKEAEKAAAAKAGVTLDANGKAKGSEANLKKYNQMIAQLKTAKTAAVALVKSGGSLKTANQQLKIQILQAQQKRVATFKKFVDTMGKSIQTQKMFIATIQRSTAAAKGKLAIMQHGSNSQMKQHMNTQLTNIDVQYDDKIKQSQDNQSALRASIQEIKKTGKLNGKALSKQEQEQQLVQRSAALKKAEGAQATYRAQKMQQKNQTIMTYVQGIQSQYSAKRQAVSIQQDRAQNVSGTTQQWMKLQNQKLNLQQQQVNRLQDILQNADKLGLSQQNKLELRNKLAQKSLDLQKAQIGAQRNVFEKMLGSLLGGLQQQGAFKGFSQASVFGVGHGVNQAGMAVAQGEAGNTPGSYAGRLLAMNAPTETWGTKGSETGVTNQVNNMGSTAGGDNRSAGSNVANNSSSSTSSSSSASSTTAPKGSGSGGSSSASSTTAPKRRGDTQRQHAETQQKKKLAAKQRQNANLKDHDIWAKQLTVQQRILQIIQSGVGVAIDKVTGQPTSTGKTATDGTAVKGTAVEEQKKPVVGGTSRQTSLQANKDVQIVAKKEQIAQLQNQLQMADQLGASQKDKQALRNKLAQLKEQLKAYTAVGQNEKQEQSTDAEVKKVQGKPRRITQQQYQTAQQSLQKKKNGFLGLFGEEVNKFSKRRKEIGTQQLELQEKIKGAKSIDQKKKYQQQYDALQRQFQQTIVDQKKAQQIVQQFKKQKSEDKTEYQSALKKLEKQGDNPWTLFTDQGQTQFEQTRQSLNRQHARIQQKIKTAKTPQERAQLQKKKADIQRRNQENNEAEARAQQIVRQYRQYGNLDNMYNRQQNQTPQGKKKQGVVSVSQQTNNQQGNGQGNIRRIPFEDMSSDNSRGKINGYIEVQVVRRVVLNSSDQSFMKKMSPLQGSGSV